MSLTEKSIRHFRFRIASQAFDEPLSKAEVLAIAGLFIRK
jgi:hypothetical protein